ncbi:MAG: FHA domain-containing protein [Paludibacteraceae bacterium]|nr:FHA domain-containing protein [Paludibacteraceae bacterium]
MKRFIFFVLFFVPAVAFFAQQRGASDFNTDDFPNVSFTWNEYNPEPIQGSQVSLKEDYRPLSFSWRNATPSHVKERNKSVVILWEDMISHGEQSDFTSAMLRSFFSSGISKNDCFNIIAFNRDKGDGDFMHSVTNGFTSDIAYIKSELFSRSNSQEQFRANPYSANIYQALDEAISLLGKEPKDNLKVIILISAGMNMNTAGAPKEFVSAEALKRNIPVYIVKYPLNGDFSHKDIEGIEKITYGELIVPANTRDDYGTAMLLKEAYNKMSRRHYGQDYKVSFSSSGKRDGKTHNITLTINGTDHKFTYTSPEFSLKIWIQENPGLTIAAGCAAFLLLVLIIVLVVYSSKKRRAKDEAFRRENELLQAKMEQQKAEMQQKLDAERKIREGEAAIARKKEQQAQFESRQKELDNIMRTKNLYPRLVFSIDGETRTEVVSAPVVRIGRDAVNDIVIGKPTVSRAHAVISFNGSGFEISNVSNTNKTIVNGQFVDKAALKPNDIIGIGEVTLNFYI